MWNSKRQFWQKQAHRHTLDVIISCTLLIQLSSNSVDHRRLYRVHFTTSEKGEPEYVQSKSVIVISCNGLHYGGKHNSIDSQWLKSKGGNTRHDDINLIKIYYLIFTPPDMSRRERSGENNNTSHMRVTLLHVMNIYWYDTYM